jgi:hypothetical protein
LGRHLDCRQSRLGGSAIVGLPANSYCDSWLQTGDETQYFNTRWDRAIGAPRVRIESRCGWWAGCSRNGVAAIHTRNVDLRIRDDTPPTLGNGRGALWTSDGWLAGTQSVGFDAADSAGIQQAS